MIIDCHGHYTTAPKALEDFRKRQIAMLAEDPGGECERMRHITDEQIRESLETNQLRIQQERGVDLTLFSPRAGGMAHHIGDTRTSELWTRHCNDLIHRAVCLFPTKLAGVCQLPQSPGVSTANCVSELVRCVQELGFVGCNINPDPTDGYWTDPPLSAHHWYPLFEKWLNWTFPE